MKGITPHLWFENEAREAAQFYTSLFDNSKVENRVTIHDTPSGDCDIVYFELAGQRFVAISAGPLFRFNPSISFQIKCATKEEVDTLWRGLSMDGAVLMELASYPFSESFGWCMDRYGLSWQVMLVDQGEIPQKITPMLMFVGENAGKAEEAIDFYTSVFPRGRIDTLTRYGPGEEPDTEGSVKYAVFSLLDMQFAAMDSAHPHGFDFNESISFIVNCDTQQEIDEYWSKLSAVRESEQCGWLKDQYGVSWQIVPTLLDEMMQDKDDTKLARVTQAFLEMKKLDIEALRRAYSDE